MGEGLRKHGIKCNYWTFWNPGKVACKDCGSSPHPERPMYRYVDGSFQCDFCYCKEHGVLYSELQVYADPFRLNDRRKKDYNGI